jgi:hypothetical protein
MSGYAVSNNGTVFLFEPHLVILAVRARAGEFYSVTRAIELAE